MSRAKAIPETITIHVPFNIAKRGGRKELILPTSAPVQRKMNDALVKALARAFRWKRMLESGEFVTIGDLASKEGIGPSYVTRVIRMTLLAPDIIEAIVEGQQGPEVTLAGLLEPFPAEWVAQQHLPPVR